MKKIIKSFVSLQLNYIKYNNMRIEKGYIPLFNAGHCDLVLGEYEPLTSGKQYTHPGEDTYHEGRFNRHMVSKIIHRLYLKKVPYGHINPELEDIALNKLRIRANKIAKYNPKVYVLSLHSNAGKGLGIEGFTTRGQTGSDIILDYILGRLEQRFSYVTKMRFDLSDGDRDKERDFSILLCNPYAMLLELGFFDNKKDYTWMVDEGKLNVLADILAEAIEHIYLNGLQ